MSEDERKSEEIAKYKANIDKARKEILPFICACRGTRTETYLISPE